MTEKNDEQTDEQAKKAVKKKQAMSAADCKRYGLDPTVYGHRRTKSA